MKSFTVYTSSKTYTIYAESYEWDNKFVKFIQRKGEDNYIVARFNADCVEAIIWNALNKI